MRTSIHKTISDPITFKKNLLAWAQNYREVVFLDSNSHKDKFYSYDCVLAIDAFTSIKTDYANAFEDLKQYQQTTKDWLFGYLSYDLKNNIENLKSMNFDGLNFPDLFFFQPKKLFLIKDSDIEICYLNMCDDELVSDFDEINRMEHKEKELLMSFSSFQIEQKISKDNYYSKILKIIDHIQKGCIYEVNFCMEFFAKNAMINPLEKYHNLNQISKAPFSIFFKNNKYFLLSASPERYLKKDGENLISQPIKGTSKRFLNYDEDQKSKLDLAQNPKERSENIMIADLVRNDLSRTAQKGSVQVEELCKVYSFLQVHQMITTISSKLNPDYSAIDAIKASFPMGSMTGAPKISAMQIIDDLEETKRGLYSGSFGYFKPNGDFDFNVVIRSILFNQEEKYVSFSVGSAITSLSNPEQEYKECLLKAKAMFEVLS